MGRGVVYIGFWWGNLRQRDHWEDRGIDGRIIFRWIFRKCDVGAWNESSCRWRALLIAEINLWVP
jgi:hypothetical protein